MNEELGHLIRKYRFECGKKAQITVPKGELLAILNAADIGVYLQNSMDVEIKTLQDEVLILGEDLNAVKADRTQLREAYKKDKQRIKKLGFKDLKFLLSCLETGSLVIDPGAGPVVPLDRGSPEAQLLKPPIKDLPF